MTETYENDPGLLQLASSQAKCWGHFANHKECRSCPIRGACRTRHYEIVSEAAESMDSMWEYRSKLHPDAAPETEGPQAAPETEGPQAAPETVPEMHPVVTRTGLTANEISDLEKTLREKCGVRGFSHVTLPFEGVCGYCYGTIPPGKRVVHIHERDVGVLHYRCAVSSLERGDLT